MSRLKQYLLNLFKKNISGKIQFQRFFNLTKVLSLQGLNYGNGGSIEIGGELALMKRLAKKYTEDRAYIIFDAGANEGGYCAALLKNIPVKNLQVWCFEPSKHAFQNLQANHGAKTNVVLVNAGFGNEYAEVPLYTSVAGADIASVFPLERASGASGPLTHFEIVTITKIDDLLKEKNIPYIDLLKLDIEGNELNALFGAAIALNAGKIKAIQFEFGTCNIDSRTYFRDFWNLLSPRYDLYRVLRNGLYPIKHYSEFDEVFQTINYYAELK